MTEELSERERVAQDIKAGKFGLPVKSRHNLSVLTYEEGVDDPRGVILSALGGKHNDITPLGSRLLVAMAPEPVKRGSLIMTDNTLKEGRWQGKVGLVLSMGPSAFKFDGSYEWEGARPEIGDWVAYYPSDTREVAINGVLCRWVHDAVVQAIVSHPEAVY